MEKRVITSVYGTFIAFIKYESIYTHTHSNVFSMMWINVDIVLCQWWNLADFLLLLLLFLNVKQVFSSSFLMRILLGEALLVEILL